MLPPISEAEVLPLTSEGARYLRSLCRPGSPPLAQEEAEA